MVLSISTIVQYLSGGLGILVSMYGLYFALVALLGQQKRRKSKGGEPPVTKFAVIVPARNEEAVIGNLITSLQQQNYPKDLFDVYVAPNNCTDDTREIAISYGAKIFDPMGEIRSKGDVLTQFVNWCMEEKKYDAICVFDADNLVHSDFLQQMDHKKQLGAQVAQGFKNSKNPSDSGIAMGFSIYYWIIGHFFNSSREALALSSFIFGTGFMVTIAFLEKMGGWHTKTITEDYEFSAQCVLAGERVHYAADAIVYDEQPLTFIQAWKQRRRWSTGYFACTRLYFESLWKHAVNKRSSVCLDVTITYLGPVFFILSLLAGIGQMGLLLFGDAAPYDVNELQLVSGVLSVGLTMGLLLATLIVYRRTRKTLKGAGKGIVFFILLLLSWIPINLISLIKKQEKWDSILHTRAITIHEM